MFQKIVVAIDGSETSNKALEKALSLAKDQKVELNILHVGKDVISATIALGAGVYFTDEIREEITSGITKQGEEILAKAKQKAVDCGVVVKTVFLQGDAAQQILKYAQEAGAELIVLGNRGLSGLKEIFLGSVSQKIVQMSTCSVLIVR